MHIFKYLVVLLLLPGVLWAQNVLNYSEQGGGRWVVGGELAIVDGALIDSSDVAYSTTLTGNPLTQQHYDDLTVAEVNATHVILASASGKAIHLSPDFGVYASGTPSTATAISLKCSGGNIITTFPVATLVDDTPVGPFSSSAITRGTALIDGCPAGEAVLVSATGTVATMTRFFFKGDYSVQ